MAELLFLTKRRRSKEGGLPTPLAMYLLGLICLSFSIAAAAFSAFFLALQHPLLGKLPVILRVHVLRLKHWAVTKISLFFIISPLTLIPQSSLGSRLMKRPYYF